MHLIYLVHSLDIGGTERLVVDLVRRFRMESEVTVCCLDHAGVWGEELSREGVPVTTIGRKPGIDVAAVWRLGKLFRRHCHVLVHCHQYPAFFYGVLGAFFAPGASVLFTEHGRAYPDIVSRRRRLVNRLLVRRTARLTSVSHAVKEALVALDGMPADRIRVIHNGIDPERYIIREDVATAQRMALGVGRGELVVGTLGRLDPVKDHLTLLRAFAQVRAAVPEARLLIAGDGETRSSLEEAVQSLHLGKAVSLLGFRTDVSQLLAAFDVFVLPSRNESMPVTVLEAMAAGLPVVATAVGDIPKIVVNEVTARLCQPADPDSLADVLIQLLRDSALRRRMGLAGQERLKQYFTTDRMVDDYRAIYRELVARD